MEHNIIVINSNGGIGINGKTSPLNSKSFRAVVNQIDKFPLKSTVIYMNESEYNDIMAWGREEAIFGT